MFKASYEEVYGKPEWGAKFEDGTPVWEYLDDVQYMRRFPGRESGLIVFANGKNDHSIGWPQAVSFLRALQETRRPHVFAWGQASHGERAWMPGGDQRIMPFDIRNNQTLPAFTESSLDDNPGSGSPDDGDPGGQINRHLLWETKDIVDEEQEWGMTIGIFPNAPRSVATLSVTPRRCQKFKPQPGERVGWTNRSICGIEDCRERGGGRRSVGTRHGTRHLHVRRQDAAAHSTHQTELVGARGVDRNIWAGTSGRIVCACACSRPWLPISGTRSTNMPRSSKKDCQECAVGSIWAAVTTFSRPGWIGTRPP